MYRASEARIVDGFTDGSFRPMRRLPARNSR
ncbi:hypothetical protein [Paenibacillus tyrfis]